MSETEHSKKIQRALPFYDSLTAQQRERLLADFRVLSYKGDELITFECDRKDGMLIVIRGRIRVFLASDSGKEISILLLEPGDVFNILTIDHAYPSDVLPMLQATEDCEIAYIRRDRITPLAYEVPEVAEFIFSTSGRNAQDILNFIERHFFRSLRCEIAGLLLEQSYMTQTDIVSMTHEQMAGHLGTSREVISRELAFFRSIGAIHSARGRIRILDLNKLRLYAGVPDDFAQIPLTSRRGGGPTGH